MVSTTHITLPRPCSAGSVIASQTLPSSSSASPARAMNAGRLVVDGPEVGVDVAAGGGGEQRGDDAEADGAGREVEDVGVLRPARVGLQPTEVAQPREVGAVELAGEVLDGVVHGRGVRLDGDLVGAARWPNHSAVMIADHRRRRRLVAADLELKLGVASRRGRCGRPLTVGGIDHPRRQPQNSAFDLDRAWRPVYSSTWHPSFVLDAVH